MSSIYLHVALNTQKRIVYGEADLSSMCGEYHIVCDASVLTCAVVPASDSLLVPKIVILWTKLKPPEMVVGTMCNQWHSTTAN